MAYEKTVRFQIKIAFTDQADTPPLQAYAFTNQGKLLGSAPVEKGSAMVELPADMDGRTMEIVLGPRVEKGKPSPSAASLKRMGAFAKPARFLAEKPSLELTIPGSILPSLCFCLVRGRLVKRYWRPDGTLAERPVCNARVHICEVDRIPLVIKKLPEYELIRLRDDLLEKLRVIPWPGPPDPGPLKDPVRMPIHSHAATGIQSAEFSAAALEPVAALTSYHSLEHLRSRLIDLSSLIVIHLCDLIYLWPFFRVDCLTDAYVDGEGRFSTFIAYNCADQPDLYFWVEQFQEGAWHTVFRPSVGCGTHWNYVCGTEIVLNLPGAVACEEPTYDIPPGVTLFVTPWSIGNSGIWGTPPPPAFPPGSPSPPAPDGWVRPDGYINYYNGGSLEWLYNAPFGGTLNFIQDDSFYIPSSGIKYYRYSYRRVVSGASPNTGADDPTWTPILAGLSRGYRMEYNDRLPTYEVYPVGPVTVGTHSGLFEFKPQDPPVRPTDSPTVEHREWITTSLTEVAASWDTTIPAPAMSDENITDDAGDFEVKIEVFGPTGNQVAPGASTFRFLARNPDGTTSRLATPAEISGDAYILRVHVDNNGVEAVLPQPSIDDVAASDDCGFLRYEAGDMVHIQYRAAHPNNHAVFGFGITRGSNSLASASTLAPYVEVAAASAPTGSATPYTKVSGNYQRDFTPVELVGTCVNAAFAASLGVYGKAFNGYVRLGLDASRLIAFALAEQEDDE